MVLSEAEQAVVARLLKKQVESPSTFKLFGPTPVVEDPEIILRAGVIEALRETKWWLKYSDGEEVALTFTQLMVLTYAAIYAAQAARGNVPAADFKFSVEDVMKEPVVQVLLLRVDIENVPREFRERIKRIRAAQSSAARQ